MDYTLIKTNRKSVALEISPDGTLIVRAPLRYTKDDADKFVNEHEKWILKHLPSVLAKKQEISLLSDKDIALAAVGKAKNKVFEYISPRLQNDEDIKQILSE